MNSDLARLHPYPFEKLKQLRAGTVANAELSPIALGIGEPKHPPPEFVLQTLRDNLDGIASYPLTKGIGELRQSIANWLTQRFQLPSTSLDPEQHVLPVNGTREALFAFSQAVLDRNSRKDLVLMPNPFYQIYEGGALLAGLQPWFYNTVAENQFQPNFDAIPDTVWQRCQLLTLCSPSNPTGSVLSLATLQKLLNLAEKHDFIIASDECYSEIYFDEQQLPVGLLQAAATMGNHDYRRCVVFHSLSKRSNLPGLRSGFVAGDAQLLKQFLLYRTYHGCAMSLPVQHASIAAWNDETHVKENRDLYREKFTAVLKILSPVLEVQAPEAAFYLWPKTPISDTDFALGLYRDQNVGLLPGSYLSRHAHGLNPGQQQVRLALVAELSECVQAAERIRAYCNSL